MNQFIEIILIVSCFGYFMLRGKWDREVGDKINDLDEDWVVLFLGSIKEMPH